MTKKALDTNALMCDNNTVKIKQYYDSVHNNSFASEAFIVIGDVFLALFTMRSL